MYPTADISIQNFNNCVSPDPQGPATQNTLKNLSPKMSTPYSTPLDSPIICQNLEVPIRTRERSDQHTPEKHCENQNTGTKIAQIPGSVEKTSLSERRKIIILADNQGYKIRETLQNLTGEEFIISCYSKYGAPLKEVLGAAKDEIKKLNSNDFIIILAGIHDKNPNELLFSLNEFLCNTYQPNIIISEIPRNKCLNEKKLNYEIKFACTKFKNANFVDMKYSVVTPKRIFFPLHTAQSLLKEILRVDYKLKYDLYCKGFNNNDSEYTHALIDRGTQTDIILKDLRNISTQTDMLTDTAQSNQSNDFFRVQQN